MGRPDTADDTRLRSLLSVTLTPDLKYHVAPCNEGVDTVGLPEWPKLPGIPDQMDLLHLLIETVVLEELALAAAVTSDLALASLINSIADKVDAMAFREDSSLEALHELQEIVSDILSYSS